MFPLFRIYQKRNLPFRRATTTGIEPALFLTSILAPLLTKILTISSYPGTNEKDLFEELRIYLKNSVRLIEKIHKKLPHSVAIWRAVSPNWLTWFISAPKWISTFTQFWFPERAASWRGVFPWIFTTLTLAPFAMRNPTALTWPEKCHRESFERQEFETILSIFFSKSRKSIPVDKHIFIQNWSHPGCRRAVKKKEKLSYRF